MRHNSYVYKAFQERLQVYEYCWLSHLPYMYPSPLQIACKHNYLCGILNYLITEQAIIYVTHAASHACRLTIWRANAASVEHSENRLMGTQCFSVLVRTASFPKIKAKGINRVIKTYLTRYLVHMGPWTSLAWFLEELVCSINLSFLYKHILKLRIHKC